MTHRSLLALTWALALGLGACSRSGTSGSGTASPDGKWTGAFEVQGTTLRLEVYIKTGKSGELTAEMVSLDQGGVRIPVESISIQDGEMAFSAEQIAGSYQGTVNEQGTAAIGTWSQFDNILPLTLKKE